MRTLYLYLSLLHDLIYSLCFCLRCLPFNQAIKIPINISHKVKVNNIYKGCIVFNTQIKRNILYIGHQGFTAINQNESLINIEKGSQLVINGHVRFAQGNRIWIENQSKIVVGDNFYSNTNCFFRAYDDIIFGKDVLLGWNIDFNTSDGHSLFNKDGVQTTEHAPIKIEDKVWIGSNVTISKGVNLPKGTVVAQRSLVTGKFSQENTLLGGIPAKIIKTNINWKI